MRFGPGLLLRLFFGGRRKRSGLDLFIKPKRFVARSQAERSASCWAIPRSALLEIVFSKGSASISFVRPKRFGFSRRIYSLARQGGEAIRHQEPGAGEALPVGLLARSASVPAGRFIARPLKAEEHAGDLMVRKRFGLTHQSEALRWKRLSSPKRSLPDFPTEALQLLEQGRGKRFQLGYPLKRSASLEIVFSKGSASSSGARSRRSASLPVARSGEALPFLLSLLRNSTPARFDRSASFLNTGKAGSASALPINPKRFVIRSPKPTKRFPFFVF